MRRDRLHRSCSAIAVCFAGIIGVSASAFAQTPSPPGENPKAERLAIEKLIARLTSGEPTERVVAAQKICNLGESGMPALPAVISLLADETQVRTGGGSTQLRNIIDRMLTDAGPSATESLIAGLANEDRKIRMAVADVLGNRHEIAALPALCRLLNREPPEVAGHAALALGMLGEPGVEPLLEALATKDCEARLCVAITLTDKREPRFVHPIAQLLYDDDQNVRAFAFERLARLTVSSRTNFVPRRIGFAGHYGEEHPESDPIEQAREKNDSALKRIVVDEINTALRSENLGAKIAATHLGGGIHSPETVDALAQNLVATDEKLRVESAQTISTIDDPRVFDALSIGLNDKSRDVRAVCANGLQYRIASWNKNNPREQLLPTLISALADFDPDVRKSAAQAITNLNSVRKLSSGGLRTAGEGLLNLLDDWNPEVAAVAIESLAALKYRAAIEPIHALLENPELKTKAALALTAFGDARAIPTMRGLLSEKDPVAFGALANLHDRQSIPTMIDQLTDRNVSSAAAAALGQFCDNRAVEPLLSLLDDADQLIADDAARALGNIRDVRAVEPLIEHLKRKGQTDGAVAESLAAIHDPRAIKPLVEAAAAGNLFQFGFLGQDVGPRQPGDNPVSIPLKAFGFQAVEQVAAALKSESTEVRQVAAYVLHELTNYGEHLDREDLQPAIEPLAAALSDQDASVRRDAAFALGHLHDPRAVDGLLNVIVDPSFPADPWVGSRAASELGHFKDEKLVDQLLVIIEDERPEVRLAAAEALVYTGNARAVEPLLRLLDDPDADVRGTAGWQIANLRSPATVGPLILRLARQDVPTRMSAARALGRIGDRKAIQPLVKLLEDDDLKVQIVAAVALLQLEDERAVKWIANRFDASDAEMRQFIFQQLDQPPTSYAGLLAVFERALDDPSQRVRSCAVSALRDLKTTAAADALWAKRNDEGIRQEVVSALVQMKDLRAIP